MPDWTTPVDDADTAAAAAAAMGCVVCEVVGPGGGRVRPVDPPDPHKRGLLEYRHREGAADRVAVADLAPNATPDSLLATAADAGDWRVRQTTEEGRLVTVVEVAARDPASVVSSARASGPPAEPDPDAPGGIALLDSARAAPEEVVLARRLGD